MNINQCDSVGNTPIIDACIESNYELVKILIKSGAKLDIANNEGHTPLMIACIKTDFDIIKLLIENGADMNMRTHNGDSALSCMFGDYYLYGDKNDFEKHLEITRYFVENKFKIDVKEVEGWNYTELLSACWCNSTKAAMYLIDNGANVNNYETESYFTPLKSAIENKNKILIEHLINNGAYLVMNHDCEIMCSNKDELHKLLLAKNLV
jgi:ankyrin repeat protein